jgi:hypothetical protein
MHLDPAPEKGGIAGHTATSLASGTWTLNSTKVLARDCAKRENQPKCWEKQREHDFARA